MQCVPVLKESTAECIQLRLHIRQATVLETFIFIHLTNLQWYHINYKAHSLWCVAHNHLSPMIQKWSPSA